MGEGGGGPSDDELRNNSLYNGYTIVKLFHNSSTLTSDLSPASLQSI